MEMFYNSDQFVVVRFEVPLPDAAPQTAGTGRSTPSSPGHEGPPAADAQDAPLPAPVGRVRGGYEIVDKHNRKEIFLEGLLAEAFQAGVRALVAQGPSEEALDEYIGRYTTLAHQPVALH